MAASAGYFFSRLRSIIMADTATVGVAAGGTTIVTAACCCYKR